MKELHIYKIDTSVKDSERVGDLAQTKVVI